VLLLDVDPLDILPGRVFSSGVLGFLLVLELVVHIRLPSDTFLVDGDALTVSLVSNFVRIGENTLGDESTRDGRSCLSEGRSCNGL